MGAMGYLGFFFSPNTIEKTICDAFYDPCQKTLRQKTLNTKTSLNGRVGTLLSYSDGRWGVGLGDEKVRVPSAAAKPEAATVHRLLVPQHLQHLHHSRRLLS